MSTHELINQTMSESRHHAVLDAGDGVRKTARLQARPLHEFVNLEELMERIDDDTELLAEVLVLFQTEFPALHSALRSAIDSGDLQRVQIAAHGLKGMLANLAICRGASVAAQIEETARSGDRRDLIAEMSALDHEMECLLPSVEAYLAGAK